MKTLKLLFVALITLAFSNSLKSQDSIPNAGLEYWFSGSSPKYWETTNMFLPFGLTTCFRTEDSHSGEYAMLMQTIKLEDNLIPGVATIGTLDYYSAYGGVPYTERPSALTGFVKHPGNGDSVFIAVQFFKNGIEIGSGIWGTKDSIPEYSQFVAPISFSSSMNPDTMNIVMLTDWNKQGSTMIVDDLELSIQTAIDEPKTASHLHLYPNPANNFINIETDIESVQCISIYNLAGIEIKKIESVFEDTRIDISSLKPGSYLIAVNGKDQSERKLFIKN
jgi:hypothetical protein